MLTNPKCSHKFKGLIKESLLVTKDKPLLCKQAKLLKLELFWFNSIYAIFYYTLDDCNYLIDIFLLKTLSQVVSSYSWQLERFPKARNEINGSCRK